MQNQGKKLAVLGAGPSGMMAAHAAAQCGYYVKVFDREPSQVRRNSGVFYIHDDCDLLLDSIKIRQTVLGCSLMTPDEISLAYSNKVYGKPSVGRVSVMNVITEDETTGYNAAQAVDRLWDLYGGQVEKQEIEGMNSVDYLTVYEGFDKVISTIPAYVLYPGIYDSSSAQIKVGKAPEDEAFIFYNLNSFSPWYRCSAMFGLFIMEYGINGPDEPTDKPSDYQWKTVTKVIGNGVISDREDLFLVGRYGAWNKTTLTHDVYYETLKWLEKNN